MLTYFTILGAQDTGKYEYPLNPDMTEWKTLPVEEKNKLLQIPEDKIKSMPTERLIQAYIDNPFCSLMFAYNTIQDGFSRVYNEFNGLRELMKRKDAAVQLYDFYKSMQVDGYDENWEPSKKGKFTFKFIYIETLFSQPEIIHQLNENGAKLLIVELIKKYELKVEHLNEHSVVGLTHCAYAMAHILNSNQKLAPKGLALDQDMQSFLETGRLYNNNTLDQILQKSRSFAKN